MKMSPTKPAHISTLIFFLMLQVFSGITRAQTAQPPSNAQSGYQPSPENLKARQEFQDMKFGMFIHWGVYSVLGDGEWMFHDRKLQLNEYERLPKLFDPEKF